MNDNINYTTFNNLSLENVLLSQSNMQYQLEVIYYILSIILEKYFRKTMRY